ncbi:ABC transporter ATP-binding protein [Reyranella sp. MMS21-HV4-11]|uniref:ABC transporter ATP-binding protein n=1 Tax=Reyranella humidisoli TaxID=2849149 RepID=A0ABS6IF60_9HYPH|nr:ABC transporter transmembrane domain-containing protein [Reyranella sp. MMS21-HV4-11]MBU8872893.1 ABC transporter ATP-binding protein [Reyranella sp. MMS21-HV4-11]
MAAPEPGTLLPRRVAGYVVAYSGRHQIGLAALSVAVFALAALPLELQRRLVNTLVDHGSFSTVMWLAGGYAGVALAEQVLKLLLNVYRGWVAEDSVRNLRSNVSLAAERTDRTGSTEEIGAQISMMLEEAEPIGGFTGISLSEPLLQAGILVSLIGYMVMLDWRLALLGLAFFLPQTVFVPLLQAGINRRARERILVKRSISAGVVDHVVARTAGWAWARGPIGRVFTLNMGIYRRKFTLNLLMNMMHHLGVASALCLGGWQVLAGRMEVGTVVAIVGGLGKLNDPWGDLVNWAREFAVVSVKYRLFSEFVNGLSRRTT